VPLEYSVRGYDLVFCCGAAVVLGEPLRVLFSLVYLLVRCLLGMLVTVVRAEQLPCSCSRGWPGPAPSPVRGRQDHGVMAAV
jgi:hypothetical protein